MPGERETTAFSSITSGALAGASVDTLLFPLDTLKTRLQSKAGFLKAGGLNETTLIKGFSKIYSGLSSALVGSAPSAALFFLTYDTMKRNLGDGLSPWKHMFAASTGEIAACLVRVPTDVVKQRMQVGMMPNLTAASRDVYTNLGLFGFYRGFRMTIFREIPFACIQFPLYEKLKSVWASYSNIPRISPGKAAVCGMIAGGIAAGVTTPLDVMKTRIMLSNRQGQSINIKTVFLDILRSEGPKTFFSGIVPRVFWISIGGSIFLGVYEFSQERLL
jgi:solute carrier family 25 S-adenosylmethionine transporter 26